MFEIAQEILSVGSASWVDGQHFYDVAPDGRFLMGRRVAVPESEPQTFVLIMNFSEDLRGR